MSTFDHSKKKNSIAPHIQYMKNMIIDFHTHAFPDKIAEHAISTLQIAAKTKANTRGTITSLLESMDKAEIDTSVICSIATKAEQYLSILNWSKTIRSKRIIPFPSIHPNDPQAAERVAEIKTQGFLGIKMHPYYQNFYMTDQKMEPIYRAISEHGLLLVMHTGFDIAFPYERRASPTEIIKVIEQFPELKLMTTHFGGWDNWQEVEETLIGKPIYIETSLAFQDLSIDQAKRMVEKHPADYLLFGSDSPWEDQKEAIERLRKLSLKPALEQKILYKNSARLLGLHRFVS